MPGLVPEYEEYAAMVTAHCNPVEWRALPPDERARAVAFRRLRKLEELHGGDAAQAQAERQTKRAGRR